MVSDNNKTDDNTDSLDLEQLLEKRARLDSLLKQKFIKDIAVMFTDLKDSTSLAESEGDLPIRLLIKRQNDILFPLIEKNKGTLIKTMGDGTLSYFKSSQNAVKAAIQFQKSIAEENDSNKNATPIHIKIGIHSGPGIVEKNDVFGDVVNVASRFVDLASAGEIYLSEDAINSLEDKNDIFCRFIMKTNLKGKKESFKIYKAFWNEEEIEQELLRTEPRIEIIKKDEILKTIPLDRKSLIIGRSNNCDIVLDETYISREHARLYFKDGSYFVEDLASEIGTILNTTEISGHRPLKDGDEIVFGAISIIFQTPPPVKEPDDFSESANILSEDEELTTELSIFGSHKLIALSEKGKFIEYIITGNGLLIGRLKKNDVRLNDKAVSRQHARVWCEEGKVYIKDLGSRNGTFVGKKKIVKTMVEENQEIRIASFRLFVQEASKEFVPPIS